MTFEQPQPADERAHVPTDEPLWGESHYLDFVSRDGALGGYVRVGKYPNLGVTWYWGCVVGHDRPLVTVIDHTVPLPANPESLELRHDGLWADHNVETTFEHYSVGLEAFGVAFDDPADVYRDAFGERTPLGFDLEWETDGRVFRYPEWYPRYEIPCRVHGEILVGDEQIDFDGVGQRDHSWGKRDWWGMGWCWTAFHLEDGTHIHAIQTKPATGFAYGYVQQDGIGEPGDNMELVQTFDADETLGPEGIPTSAVLTVNDRQFAMEPIAWSPVLLESPEGALSRFPRASMRVVEIGGDDNGRAGVGWIEFNQPQMPA